VWVASKRTKQQKIIGLQHNIAQPDGNYVIGENKNRETAMKKG
jgi:hypothetical protein